MRLARGGEHHPSHPPEQFEPALWQCDEFRSSFDGESLLHGLETVLEVGEDVVDLLGADGEADGALMDTLILELLSGQLRVRGGSGVDD